MEIALRVVQFWSEIKLVITNRTPASRSCDFVITRLISDQIALHSVQLPLLTDITEVAIITKDYRDCKCYRDWDDYKIMTTEGWCSLWITGVARDS